MPTPADLHSTFSLFPTHTEPQHPQASKEVFFFICYLGNAITAAPSVLNAFDITWFPIVTDQVAIRSLFYKDESKSGLSFLCDVTSQCNIYPYESISRHSKYRRIATVQSRNYSTWRPLPVSFLLVCGTCK